MPFTLMANNLRHVHKCERHTYHLQSYIIFGMDWGYVRVTGGKAIDLMHGETYLPVCVCVCPGWLW